MSHIVTIEAQMTNPAAVARACTLLELPEPVHGEHKVFSRNVTGLAVRLPGWTYPAVVDEAGKLQYDNYNGSWGKQEHVDRFAQYYPLAAAQLAAETAGARYSEIQIDADTGDVFMDVEIGRAVSVGVGAGGLDGDSGTSAAVL